MEAPPNFGADYTARFRAGLPDAGAALPAAAGPVSPRRRGRRPVAQSGRRHPPERARRGQGRRSRLAGARAGARRRAIDRRPDDCAARRQQDRARAAGIRSPSCIRSTSTSRPGSASRSSARRAAASRRCSGSSPVSTPRRPAAILIDGVDITTLDEDQLARLRGEKVGFVFQFFHLVPSLTALENILVPMEIAGRRDARPRAQALLDEVGLHDRGHHYPSQLSGGEQQRIAIARALANDPPLDPGGRADRQPRLDQRPAHPRSAAASPQGARRPRSCS